MSFVRRGISRRECLGLITVASLGSAAESEEWIDLFDGRTLAHWRASEHKDSWSVADGALTANGPRSHLFYTGPVRGANFRNFELVVELTTQPECNSGVYFHTAYQETGFPQKGFEIQVNNTALGDGGYLERKKTASLYGLRNIYKQLVPDRKPFQLQVAVRGKNVQIRLNHQLVVNYIEPTPPVIPEGGEKMRFLDQGTIALQCHNDGSRVSYRKVRIRPLPDDLPAYTGTPLVADDVYRKIINIGRHNVPAVDYHVVLHDGMTLEEALQKSRRDGIFYGITGATTSLQDDATAQRWLNSCAGRPVFCGLYAAERDWTRRISQKKAQEFDYVLADSRAWMDRKGRAVRLAIEEEAKLINDRQYFMDSLVDQAVERLSLEPIDFYAFPLYLPAAMRSDAESLWTEARTTKLVDALVKEQVAVEINTREQLPGRAFLEKAKQAGCKFGFGTGNETAAELKRCEYGLQMVESCKLDWHNFFVPGAWWPKAAERRWPS